MIEEYLRWALRGIPLVLAVAFNWLWSMLILFSVARQKVPISGRLYILSVIPFGIPIYSLLLSLVFLLQMIIASVRQNEVWLFEPELREQVVAIAFGLSEDDDICAHEMCRLADQAFLRRLYSLSVEEVNSHCVKEESCL